MSPPAYGPDAVPAERSGVGIDGRVGERAGVRDGAGVGLTRQLARVGRHLRLAWPVFVIFLAQRLLTLVLVYLEAGHVRPLITRWDAGWYLRLAQGGYVYPNLTPDGTVRASNLAYFPLFPWAGRGIERAGLLPVDQALLVVSWIGGLLAVWAIFAVGHALYGRWAGIALAAVWGTAPASLTLTMAYPEGLFTAAAAATLFCLLRRRPVWAGVCAVVAGLLRPSAVAVIAMVGVYFLVELGRWFALRRSSANGPPALPDDDAEGAEPDVIRFHDGPPSQDGSPPRSDAVEPAKSGVGAPRPGRAFLGVLVSTLGLGSFMVYVGRRTGEVFGYFTVQKQWGQQTAAGFPEYWQGIEQGLFGPPSVTLIPVTIVVTMAYLLLFCLIMFDRRLVLASVYAAGMLALSLSHITFQWVYARQLLPAFVLLIPLVRMRVPRLGAVAALTVGSILMSWGSVQFLFDAWSGM